MVLLIPMLQTIIFGYAVTTDVKKYRQQFLMRQKCRKSRCDRFFHPLRLFNFDYYITQDQQMSDLMNRGKVAAILHIPRGFQEDKNGRKRQRYKGLSMGPILTWQILS